MNTICLEGLNQENLIQTYAIFLFKIIKQSNNNLLMNTIFKFTVNFQFHNSYLFSNVRFKKFIICSIV